MFVAFSRHVHYACFFFNFLLLLLSKVEAIRDFGCEIPGLRMLKVKVIIKILKTNHRLYKGMEFEIVDN